jgi:uncharacterized protein with FMN-binding domain
MRRAVSAIVVSAVAVVLVASFKTHGPHRLATLAPVVRHAAPAPTRTPSATPRAHASRPKTVRVSGDVVPTRFGDVQVAITERAGRITQVRALQLPFDHPRSQFISAQAEPLLREEALQAQSARIDIISGATYTSDGYAQSLQSALDRARTQ